MVSLVPRPRGGEGVLSDLSPVVSRKLGGAMPMSGTGGIRMETNYNIRGNASEYMESTSRKSRLDNPAEEEETRSDEQVPVDAEVCRSQAERERPRPRDHHGQSESPQAPSSLAFPSPGGVRNLWRS